MSALAEETIDTAALERWMRAQDPGFAGPVALTKFAGGQSNPTYRVDTPGGSYVLRRQPFGALLPSAHAVDREYRLIAALHPTGFPVARPCFGLCDDPAVIGSKFYMMELVEGRTLWDGTLPDMPRADRRAHYEAMVDTLADLHAIDYAAAGLGDFGKPGNYFERQVARWTRQYRAAQTDDIPAAEALIDYLARTVPPQTRTAIVHGDYRIDNMIFAPQAPRILAVLDWELSTLGDPLADFAYFAMNWVTEPEGRSGVMGQTGGDTGIPTLEEVTARYCARTGRDDVPDLNWYFAYNLFRLMGIVQGIKKRWLDGNASNAAAEATAARVPFLAEAAWGFAVKAGA
ncbi:phosphotransferase family protein [Sphingomonas qomolangmaensis]|uniref:Phosphotransferase family protein n=1 Tax=Sphingomonas qomolangmaensis TaxID=2918765 RepID=A0ABY5LC26_9SPHN|nr:phosphotransferase family protein [Sphingomonas qomolangmaensis]UUL83558.1 phosphotransferase family protein [Sphingomonas qomolangmaensis]